jgi:hypothetical protein
MMEAEEVTAQQVSPHFRPLPLVVISLRTLPNIWSM